MSVFRDLVDARGSRFIVSFSYGGLVFLDDLERRPRFDQRAAVRVGTRFCFFCFCRSGVRRRARALDRLIVRELKRRELGEVARGGTARELCDLTLCARAGLLACRSFARAGLVLEFFRARRGGFRLAELRRGIVDRAGADHADDLEWFALGHYAARVA